MQALVGDLRITTVVAGFNGGVYTTPKLDPIVMRDIPADATGRTIEIIREGGLVPWLYTDTTWYVPDPEGPHVDRESRTVGFGPEILTDYSNYLDKAAKIVGVGDDVDAVAACESKVREGAGRTCVRCEIPAILSGRNSSGCQQGRSGRVPLRRLPHPDREHRDHRRYVQ
jgi:hydroxymethylpyrimidine pyrophosphatase-like HAD family hydrolase